MTVPIGPRQLVLALDHAVSYARDDFLPGPSNAAALALIERWPDWPNRAMSASLLAEETLPTALATGALVLEDLEADGLDERALFHLLNLVREESAFLLITARTQPAGFPVTIRDLRSRLRALPAVTLDAPDDELLRLVMVKLAADRQIALDPGVANYVANRIERSFAAARAAVLRLDEESMRRHRPITRALAAELFRDGDGA